MKTYYEVWSLQSGIINPPEKLSGENQYLCQRAETRLSLERDPAMTQRQLWNEEINRREITRRKVG